MLYLLVLFFALIFPGLQSAQAATPCVTTNNTGIATASITVDPPSYPANVDATNYNNYRVWIYARADAAGTVSVDIDGDVCESLSIPAGSYRWVAGSRDRDLQGGTRSVRIIGNSAGIFVKRTMLINSNCVPVNETGDCPTDVIAPPSNTPPVFNSFTATPTSGTAPTNVKLSANVSDPDNDGIKSVDFYRNGVLLGSVTTPTSGTTYEYAANSLSAGVYTFSASATDKDTATPSTTISSNVSVTINAPAVTNSAPTVSQLYSSITNPVAPANITLTANASDPDNNLAKVEFYNGTTKLGEDTSSPHNWTLSNLAAGTYTLSAKATDTAGLTSAAKALSITVAPTPVTPPVATCSGTNIALKKTATASSVDGTFTADRAFDGSSAKGSTAADDSRWSSIHGVDPQYLMVDLGASYAIKCISINWETAAANSYKIEVSDSSNGSFKVIAQVSGGSAGTKIFDITSGSGRFVKLTGLSRTTVYGYSVWEMGVYGTAVSTSTTDTTAPTGPSSITGADLSYNGWSGACSPATSCKITLSWPAATDNTGGSGVSHYDIYNGTQKLNSSPVTGTSFDHTNVTTGGSYSYKVYSVDKAGNRSSGSAALNKSIGCTPFLWTAICGLN